MNEQEFGFETQAIRSQLERTQYLEHSVPLYLTSSFVFEDAEDMRASFAEEKERNIYSRYSNPNTNEFVDKVCNMEGAEAGFAFASGMAAVYSTFGALLQSGDHIVSASSVFGATHSLFMKYFPKWNIETSYFDINKPETIESFIKPNTKILFAESPTNPAVDIIDLELLGAIAKKHNLILIIDNCFATPYIQQPIKWGAHLVVHSATKLIDGQGRVLGGVTVGNADLIKEIYLFSRLTGPALSPFNAWVFLKGLETLRLRMNAHCQSAQQLAEWLEQQAKVTRVYYSGLTSHPQHELAKQQQSGFGAVLSFEVEGGKDAAWRFIDATQMISITANLGDTKTTITHPGTTTHGRLPAAEREQAGIHDGLIRIAVGLEDFADIQADVQRGLNAL